VANTSKLSSERSINRRRSGRVHLPLRGPIVNSEFAQMYASTYETTLRFVRRRLSDGDDAEDVVQTAFYRAFRGYRRFCGDAAFSTWLTRIAINECHTYTTRKIRRRMMEDAYADELIALVDRPPHPAQVAEAKDLNRFLRNEVDILPSPYREVILRHYYDEVLYVELANELSVPLGTVKAWLHRGRRRLRDRLETLN